MVSTSNQVIQNFKNMLESKFVKKNSTSGLLKNDGTVDTNTYITSSALPSSTSDLTNDGTSPDYATVFTSGVILSLGVDDIISATGGYSGVDFATYLSQNDVTDISNNDVEIEGGTFYLVFAWGNNELTEYNQHSSDYYIYYCSQQVQGFTAMELISQPYDVVNVIVTYTDNTTETLKLLQTKK